MLGYFPFFSLFKKGINQLFPLRFRKMLKVDDQVIRRTKIKKAVIMWLSFQLKPHSQVWRDFVLARLTKLSRMNWQRFGQNLSYKKKINK